MNYWPTKSEATYRSGLHALPRSFIDDLAESSDHTLTDLLVVSLLEGIASDAAATSSVKQHTSPKAQEMLKQIEVNIYGRQG